MGLSILLQRRFLNLKEKDREQIPNRKFLDERSEEAAAR